MIQELLFSDAYDDEVRNRALYAAARRFGRTLGVGTKLARAVDLLCARRPAETVPVCCLLDLHCSNGACVAWDTVHATVAGPGPVTGRKPSRPAGGT